MSLKSYLTKVKSSGAPDNSQPLPRVSPFCHRRTPPLRVERWPETPSPPHLPAGRTIQVAAEESVRRSKLTVRSTCSLLKHSLTFRLQCGRVVAGKRNETHPIECRLAGAVPQLDAREGSIPDHLPVSGRRLAMDAKLVLTNDAGMLLITQLLLFLNFGESRNIADK